MTQKKRILVCAESHLVNSGFGRYTKEIVSRLHANPNYEVAEFASYFYDDQEPTVPWKVYPNAVRDNSKDAELYKKSPINQFGQWRFEKVVLHFKPDIVFDMRDYWMFSYQELSPLRKYFHWVIAPTIDSIPQKTEWLLTFQNADVLLTHTDWAANYIASLKRPINLMGCVSDSVDPNTFKPITWSKSYHKNKYGIPTDSIVIGSVMRNQKRKLLAELFKSLKQLISVTGNHKIFLYLHTSYPEPQGWDIPELLHEYGVSNNVLFTYYNPIHKKIFVSPFKGAKIPSPDGLDGYAIFPNVANGVSNEQLTEIYNTFDIYVQYAICEGLGIPQLEAASCGIPIFAVNYSGMEEITTKVNGIKINYLLLKELETGSDRATPDNDDLIKKIIEWIDLPKSSKKELSKNTRELLVEHYSWDKTAEYLIKIFDGLQPKNVWDEPMTTNTKISVPNNLNNREFIDFVVDNIIMEPRLKSTHFIQTMVKNLDDIGNDDQNALMTQRQNAIKNLEIYLNNKMYCESIRSKQISLDTHEFLHK